MSRNSYITATLATALVGAVLGCDDDPVTPPDPISITGIYDYSFDVSNGEEGNDEVACDGSGVIDITQTSDSTFTAETEADGVVNCVIEGEEFSEESGVVPLAGTISNGDVAFQFPLLEDTDLCDALGEIHGNPVTDLSGTAECVIDPETLGLEGDPVTLTGTWEAIRTDG